MKMYLKTAIASCFIACLNALSAQEIDKTQLAMDVSAANEANIEKLKGYIWKMKLDGYVSNELKLTTLSEMKFDEAGKLVSTPLDASTTVKAKPGIRGRVQQSAAEENLDYVQKAAGLMLRYSYMTKGELIDLFDKASVSSTDAGLLVMATNAYQQGDEVTLLIDPETHLFIRKTFKAKSGEDPIEGTVDYATFTSSGVNHVAKSYLMMPAKAMQVNTENTEYTQRVQ